MEILYATNKQKLENMNDNLSKLEIKLENLKKEEIELKENNKKHEECIVTYEQEIGNIEQENLEFTQKVEEFAINNKEKQKYIDDLNLDITNLKISVSSFDESETSINEIVERITNDISLANNSITKKEEQIEKDEKENEKLKLVQEQHKNEIKQMEETLLSGNTDIDNLKEQKQAKTVEIDKCEENIIEQFKTIEKVKDGIAKNDVKKSKIEFDIEQVVNKLWEEYELTPNTASGFEKPENVAATTKKVNSLRENIKALGSINVDSIEEYKQTKERFDFMTSQKQDLENAKKKLENIISEMLSIMKIQFSKQFKAINKNFKETFVDLFGGGKAELKLTDESNVLESGIEIEVQPPGKKLQNMMLLSGGEKAFTAIALLFAILRLNPAPFCVLDEIEAALDDVNVYRYADHLKQYINKTQFLVITHRKGTMEAASTVYGVTMQENGISDLISLKLK